MHRLSLALLLSALLGHALAAHAQTEPSKTEPRVVNAAAPPAVEATALPLVAIERQGYAFEYPRVLAQQRLFGISHGVMLLAKACLAVPDHAAANQAAFAAWRRKQHHTIEIVQNELAHFYFGARAAEAQWHHLVRALNLRESIGLASDSSDLAAACATLPQALQKSRYDLASIYKMEQAIAATTVATRIEEQFCACVDTLPAAQSELLIERFSAWQEAQEDAAEDARDWLTEHWQDAGMEGDPDDWLEALSTRFSRPPEAACQQLAERLISPEAQLENSFVAAPEPTAVALPGAAQAPSQEPRVEPTQPPSVGDKPAPELPAAAAETSPAATEPPNLFDLIMRLFDDRSQEPRKPQHSQRAHP